MLALALALSAAVSFVVPQSAQAVVPGDWSAPIDLTDGTVDSYSPALAMSSDGLVVTAVWGQSDGLRVNSSLDGGVTWSVPRVLGDGGDGGVQIAMSSDGWLQTVVWIDWSCAGSTYCIQSASSDDRGMYWSSVPTTLAAVSDATGDFYNPDLWMSSNGLNVSVVWAQSTDNYNNYVVKSRTSLDGGEHWEAEETLSNLGDVAEPVIAGSGDATTTAAWIDDSGSPDVVALGTSSDFFATWDATTTIAAPNASDPRLVSSSDGLKQIAVWKEGGTFTSAWTDDSGATWDATVTYGGGQGSAFSAPQLTGSAAGDRATVLWRSNLGPGQLKIISSRTVNGGQTWVASSDDVSPVSASVGVPSLAASSNGSNVVAMWFQDDAFWTAASDDGGLTWTDSLTELSMSSVGNEAFAIASSGSGARTVALWTSGASPNRQLEVAVTPPAGPLTFSSGSFGSPAVGAPTSLTVTVTNSGGSSTTPSAITAVGSGVSVTGGTCSTSSAIAAAGTCTVNLAWTPSAAGTLSGATLAIAYPGGTAPSSVLTLSGTATSGGGGGSSTPSDAAMSTPATPATSTPTSTSEPAPSAPNLGNPAQITGTQLADISPRELALVPVAEFRLIPPAAFAALTPQQAEALSPGQVNAIRPARAAELTVAAVVAMSPDQLAVMRPGSVASLKPAALVGMSGEQWSALRREAVALISPRVLARLSVEQLRALTPEQVRELTPQQRAALTPAQRRALR